MELWIRNQDRKKLYNVKKLELDNDETGIFDIETFTLLGKYKSKERALEVLDEIQNKLLKSKYGKATENYGKHSDCKNTLIEISSSIYVYEMPEE